MKSLLSLCLSILTTNLYAAELRFDSIDCTKAGNPPLQSRIIVTNQANSFFSVKVVGGYPAWNPNLPHTCVDANFGGANFNKDTQSIEGYAVYSAPLLYVFVPSREGAYVSGVYVKETNDNLHALVFSLTDKGFTLLRDEALANSQGNKSSWYTVFDALTPQVIYQMIDDSGLKPINK